MEKKEKKGFFSWFRKQRFWTKLMSAFIISSIIPLIVVQGIMLYINYTGMKRKVDDLMVNELVQMAERVNLTLDIYSNLVYQIYIDNQIIENVNCLLEENSTDREVAKWEIYERIKQYATGIFINNKTNNTIIGVYAILNPSLYHFFVFFQFNSL